MVYLYSDQASKMACRVKRHAGHYRSQHGQGGGGAVSPMAETICMRMTMMGGTNAQVIDMEGAVHLLVMRMAHSCIRKNGVCLR